MNDDQKRATKSIGEAVENAVNAALKTAQEYGQLDESFVDVVSTAAQARSAAEAAMSFCFATGTLSSEPSRQSDAEAAAGGEQEEDGEGEEDGEESDNSEEEEEDDDNSIFTSDEDDIQSEDDQESSENDDEENAGGDGDGDESGQGAAEPCQGAQSSPKRARHL